MALFLLYSILILCGFVFMFSFLQGDQKEEFSNRESRWDIDRIALEEYCSGKGISISSYMKSIKTNLYPKERERLEKLFALVQEMSGTDWMSDGGLNNRWSCAITDGSVEYGYAFTIGTTMYLPLSYIRNKNDDSIMNLFIHELRHIWQRLDYNRFIDSLDGKRWKGWKFVIQPQIRSAISKIRSINPNAVINPDTIQVIAYAPNSKHPMYPMFDSKRDGLRYIIRGHQSYIWLDPHPCEWDAREIAENILNSK